MHLSDQALCIYAFAEMSPVHALCCPAMEQLIHSVAILAQGLCWYIISCLLAMVVLTIPSNNAKNSLSQEDLPLVPFPWSVRCVTSARQVPPWWRAVFQSWYHGHNWTVVFLYDDMDLQKLRCESVHTSICKRWAYLGWLNRVTFSQEYNTSHDWTLAKSRGLEVLVKDIEDLEEWSSSYTLCCCNHLGLFIPCGSCNKSAFHRQVCCFVCSAFVVTQESGFKNSACLLSPVQTRTEQVTINTLNFCWHEHERVRFCFLFWSFGCDIKFEFGLTCQSLAWNNEHVYSYLFRQ